MIALDPIDRELLDFLCACAHHRVRIKVIKAPRRASLQRLRHRGFVGLDDHLPSGSALLDWIERERTKSEAAGQAPGPEEPPAPTAAERQGGGDARCDAPPPIDFDRLLECFGDEFEQLIFVARRHGGVSTAQIVRHARTLLKRGLVEQLGPVSKRPHCLWRRNQLNTHGAPGTARTAPSAEESTSASRDSVSAPLIPSTEGPHPLAEPPTVAPAAVESAVVSMDSVQARPAFEEPSEPVDLKVNAEPKVTRPAPCAPANESQGFQRQAQRAMRTNRRNAEAFLDSGKTSNDATSVSLRIEARKVEVARADEARLLDPIEQAKTVIRVGGWRCFAAVISGGPLGKFYIGNKLVDEAGLLAFAEDLRTRRRRRAG